MTTQAARAFSLTPQPHLAVLTAERHELRAKDTQRAQVARLVRELTRGAQAAWVVELVKERLPPTRAPHQELTVGAERAHLKALQGREERDPLACER
jgi:hypothetical protein